jgi:hypothetical protein
LKFSSTYIDFHSSLARDLYIIILFLNKKTFYTNLVQVMSENQCMWMKTSMKEQIGTIIHKNLVHVMR